MRTNIVFTLTGTDRIGIVEDVTKTLLELGANVETSRMARLGGEFAILMLLSLQAERMTDLDQAVAQLTTEGFKITVTETEPMAAEARPRWLPYRVEVTGADHEGIIHDLAHGLSQLGINIESLETRSTRAPVSGSPLFTMTAVVAVPIRLAETDWIAELMEAGQQANVDVLVSETTIQ
jgi:glycine cleavage system transcriptional repressor